MAASVAAALSQFSTAPFHAQALAHGVYVVPGDTGMGSEGRPNAGFIVTDSGVAVIEALGSPWQAEQLKALIARVTPQPVRWVILTHHHPDHMMGAIVFVRGGAKVIAHPDRRVLAGENGDSAMQTKWTATVGEREMRGFAFADTPAIRITHDTTLTLGGRRLELYHPRVAAHTPGDLAVWVPGARVLFAGDLLVEDGVSLLVDGGSVGLLEALVHLENLNPRVVVPGHGRMAHDPRSQIVATRSYIDSLRVAMRKAVDDGVPLRKVLADLPQPDEGHPVSLAARRQRNAERVYLEMENALLESSAAATPPVPPKQDTVNAPSVANIPVSSDRVSLISTDSLAKLTTVGAVTVVDTRADVSYYLASHIPGAVYINPETLRAMADGVPERLLPVENYISLFNHLGLRPGRPVVVYSAGDRRNVDATYLAWIVAGFRANPVMVLNGGFAKWDLESRPKSRAYPAAVPGTFPARPWSLSVATLADIRHYLVADSLHEHNTVVVDGRTLEQYRGEESMQMRGGHIPGAIDHPWSSDLTDGLTPIFKSADTLRARYAEEGITPDKTVIVYCNRGVEASHIYFVLHDLLGYPSVKVYDASWNEYAAHEDLPVATR